MSTNIMADSPIFLNSLTDATALSETSEKNLLVIFGSKSCRYCDDLKKEINSGNLDNLLKNKIVCYIDIDDKNRNLEKEYKISIIPDSRFFIKNNQKSKIIGYEKNKYRNWLETLK